MYIIKKDPPFECSAMYIYNICAIVRFGRGKGKGLVVMPSCSLVA